MRCSVGIGVSGVVAIVGGFVVPAARGTATLTVLANLSNTSDLGGTPTAGITVAPDGSLYGATQTTVFQLAGPDHRTVVPLATFPQSTPADTINDLTVDAAGNIYGTTSGTNNTAPTGTAFSLTGADHRTVTTLATFSRAAGQLARGGLYADPVTGTLYGTTYLYGAGGAGSVFSLTGADHRTFTTLASFSDDGSKSNLAGGYPTGRLTADAVGDLFGTTSSLGPGGGGAVFELSGADHRTLTEVATFSGANGVTPNGGLVADAAGNLYGTTVNGGAYGPGTVFELSGPDHRTLTTLYSFTQSSGGNPYGPLRVDAAGDLFGTTRRYGAYSGGTLFELSGADHRTFTDLVDLSTFSTGTAPLAGLSIDAGGTLYGTTSADGFGLGGTVFAVTGSGFVVPEPAAVALVTAGIGLGLAGRRRRSGRR